MSITCSYNMLQLCPAKLKRRTFQFPHLEQKARWWNLTGAISIFQLQNLTYLGPRFRNLAGWQAPNLLRTLWCRTPGHCISRAWNLRDLEVRGIPGVQHVRWCTVSCGLWCQDIIDIKASVSRQTLSPIENCSIRYCHLWAIFLPTSVSKPPKKSFLPIFVTAPSSFKSNPLVSTESLDEASSAGHGGHAVLCSQRWASCSGGLKCAD